MRTSAILTESSELNQFCLNASESNIWLVLKLKLKYLFKIRSQLKIFSPELSVRITDVMDLPSDQSFVAWFLLIRIISYAFLSFDIHDHGISCIDSASTAITRVLHACPAKQGDSHQNSAGMHHYMHTLLPMN